MLKEGDGDKQQDEMQEVTAEATESKDSQENEGTMKSQEGAAMRESVTLLEAPARRKTRQDVRIKTPEHVDVNMTHSSKAASLNYTNSSRSVQMCTYSNFIPDVSAKRVIS